MIMKKQIDVLLVSYNQSQYIQQTLESIMMQRLDDDVQMRIIVADDCSTDGTLDIIKTYALKHKAEWVFLPNEKNMGHVRNYQRAFDACKGDYVAILEGDDYWSSPLHLQTHVDFMDVHRECVLSSQYPTWYYEEEQRFDPRALSQLPFGNYKYVTIEEEIHANRIVNLSSCVIRGEAIRTLDERIFECSVLDWPMYVNLCQKGLLCLLTGTTSVYRAKSSGLYAGLSKETELQKDEQLLGEIEKIFPQYADSYAKSRRLMHPRPKSTGRKMAECILWPFAQIGKLCSRMHLIYKEVKK